MDSFIAAATAVGSVVVVTLLTIRSHLAFNNEYQASHAHFLPDMLTGLWLPPPAKGDTRLLMSRIAVVFVWPALSMHPGYVPDFRHHDH
jgi:hypothetical protein